MKRLAVVVMVIVMAIPVFYIGSTFYAAYFFEHDFTPIESEGAATADELRYWLGADAEAVTEARGFRFKSGMPPMPRFFYRFAAEPPVIEALIARFDLQARPLPDAPPAGGQLPGWWQPPTTEGTFYLGRDRGNPLYLWYEPSRRTAHLHLRAEG